MNKKNTARRHERKRHEKLERKRIARRKNLKRNRDWARECIRRSREESEEPEDDK